MWVLYYTASTFSKRSTFAAMESSPLFPPYKKNRKRAFYVRLARALPDINRLRNYGVPRPAKKDDEYWA
jgi:hypothetical protein